MIDLLRIQNKIQKSVIFLYSNKKLSEKQIKQFLLQYHQNKNKIKTLRNYFNQ